MTEVASTYTFRPSMSKTLSINPEAFSNCMEYEKPEHPPPTTPTRRPAGAGFCCAMIPFTLAMAFGVRLMGAAFTSCGVGVVGVVVVVDITYLLESTSVNCSKRRRADSDKILLCISGIRGPQLYCLSEPRATAIRFDLCRLYR